MPSINEIAEVGERQPHLADLPPTLDDSQTGTPDRRPGSVRAHCPILPLGRAQFVVRATPRRA